MLKKIYEIFIQKRGIKKYKTCELVAELEIREGVSQILAEPYQKKQILVEGPAVILLVID